ncbi:unannotated protein [freshwater metagenome]|uniref:Unannotated protein n=1 Tax=freshwater metagenome TaxID=449393 RepID=A0A6J7EAW9_9ZZZZ
MQGNGRHGASQDLAGAREGAVVDHNGIACVQRGHRDTGAEQCPQRQPEVAPRREHGGQQREHPVELLLDRQRPEVQQRRGIGILSVCVSAEQLPPVGHLRHGGNRLMRGRHREPTHGTPEHNDAGDREQRCRQQAADTPNIELADREPTGAIALAQHGRGDQIARQGEEQRHTDETAGQHRWPEVEDHHNRHGETA